MPPTHWPLEYPELVEPLGSTQTLVAVGGQTDVVVEAAWVVVEVGVQTPTVVVGPPWGGFLERQSLLLQEPLLHTLLP